MIHCGNGYEMRSSLEKYVRHKPVRIVRLPALKDGLCCTAHGADRKKQEEEARGGIAHMLRNNVYKKNGCH